MALTTGTQSLDTETAQGDPIPICGEGSHLEWLGTEYRCVKDEEIAPPPITPAAAIPSPVVPPKPIPFERAQYYNIVDNIPRTPQPGKVSSKAPLPPPPVPPPRQWQVRDTGIGLMYISPLGKKYYPSDVMEAIDAWGVKTGAKKIEDFPLAYRADLYRALGELSTGGIPLEDMRHLVGLGQMKEGETSYTLPPSKAPPLLTLKDYENMLDTTPVPPPGVSQGQPVNLLTGAAGQEGLPPPITLPTKIVAYENKIAGIPIRWVSAETATEDQKSKWSPVYWEAPIVVPRAKGIIASYMQRRLGEATGLEKLVITPIKGINMSAEDIVGIALMAYAGFQAAKIGWDFFLRSSLSRNLDSWAKSAGEEIDVATKKNFIDWAMSNLSKKWLSEQAIKTIFKPTKAGFQVTPQTASQAESDVLALIPKGTQTGAMAFGGLPKPIKLTPELWNATPIAEKIISAQTSGLSGQVASKAFEALTEDEKTALSKVIPSVAPKAEETGGLKLPEKKPIEGKPEAKAPEVAPAAPQKVTPAPEVTKLTPQQKKLLDTEMTKLGAEKGAIGGSGYVRFEGEGANTVMKAVPTSEVDSVKARLFPELAFPKAEAVKQIPGEPEVGLQPSMIPEEIAAKEVRPAGKGKVTQISMDEQLKLASYQRDAEIQGLKTTLAEHPARDLIGIIKRSGKERGEIPNLTIEQFKRLTGKQSVRPSSLTPDGKHVRWEYSFDQLASLHGYESGEALREGILEAKAMKDQITELEGRPVEVPIEEVPVEEEVVPSEVPPVSPPPQSVTPPLAPIAPVPVGGEITRIITQSEEQIRQELPGMLTRLSLHIPGIKQILEFIRPGLKMTGENQRVLTAMVAENAAKSDVSVWAMGTRYGLLKDLREAFGKDALHGGQVENVKFVGTAEQAENSITGTIKDIADNPELYELSSRQQRVLEDMENRNYLLLDWVVTQYNAEIGEFKAKKGGAFLPNVDISEDVIEYLGSETRAAATGRGKTRIWATARERMAGKVAFKPELDIEKLIWGLDTFKASAAGGQTYRVAIGGLTRLEAMEETHPALYDRMIALRKRLNSLQGSAGTIESNVHSAIYDFLNSPAEDTDLANLRDRLDVKLKTGIRKGMDVEAIQDEIASVREDIKGIRPAWEAANLKPNVFVQEGIFRYFPSDTAKLIKESRQVTDNPLLKVVEHWRGGAFSGDMSPFAIQGVIGVLADPWGSLKASIGAISKGFAKHDLLRSVKISALADDIADNPFEWSQYASLMGRQLSGTPGEYAAGWLTKIPLIGKAIGKGTEATYITVTRGSFNLWQREYKRMVVSGVPEVVAKVAAAANVAKVYPLAHAPLAGQSQARATLLRTLPTSYSFIAQPVKLIAQATKGYTKLATFQKLTSQESLAVKSITTMAASILVASATSAAIAAMAQDKDDDEVLKAMWDAINPDPFNGKFASLIIGDKRIPLGGPYRAIFRALYPQQVKGVPFPVPGAGIPNYLYNRITPALRTQLDLWRNQDYTKREIMKGNAPERFFRLLAYEFEGALPLTAGEVAERIRQGEKYTEDLGQQVIAQFMGVNMVTLDNTYLDRQMRKLGLPQETEAKPFTINKPDMYSTKDFWGDANRVLSAREKGGGKVEGYDDKPMIKAIIEARRIKEQTDALPNVKVISINADPARGDTFIELNEQWQERQKLLKDEEALAEFDKKYSQAELGNISQRNLVLLRQYHSLTDRKAQAEFLKVHSELSENPRQEWLKSHPNENAQLAVWGQAEVLTQKAYDEAQRLIKELDIPDSAVADFLPPADVAKPSFERIDIVDKWGANSWEDKLLRAKNPKLTEWLKLGEIDTPLASLELKTIPKYHETWNKLKKEDDPDFVGNLDDKVKDKDGLTARNRARATLMDTKIPGTDLTYRDMERKVKAIEKGTDAKPIDKKLVDGYVAWKRIADAPGVGSNSAESMLARVDNPALDAFLTDKVIWANETGTEDKALEPLDQTKIPIWRIDVKYKKEFDWYDNVIKEKHDKITYANETLKNHAITVERAKYYEDNPEFRKKSLERDALSATNNTTGYKLTETSIPKYVELFQIPDKGYRDERFIASDLFFATEMYKLTGKDIYLKKLSDIPNVRYDDISDQYRKEYDRIDSYTEPTLPDGSNNPSYIPPEPDGKTRARGLAVHALKFDGNNLNKFGRADIERDAHYLRVPLKYSTGKANPITDYVGYYSIIDEGKPKDWETRTNQKEWYADDWWMMEHPEFYKEVYLGLLGNQRKNYIKVPTREVFSKYLQYVQLPEIGVQRDNFRLANLDLDNWGIIKFGWTPITAQRRQQQRTSVEKLGESIAALDKQLKRLPSLAVRR